MPAVFSSGGNGRRSRCRPLYCKMKIRSRTFIRTKLLYLCASFSGSYISIGIDGSSSMAECIWSHVLSNHETTWEKAHQLIGQIREQFKIVMTINRSAKLDLIAPIPGAWRHLSHLCIGKTTQVESKCRPSCKKAQRCSAKVTASLSNGDIEEQMASSSASPPSK